MNKKIIDIEKEYKNAPYHVGDKVHVKKDDNEYDCSIYDMMFILDYNDGNPDFAYFVELDDKSTDKLIGSKYIQYKNVEIKSANIVINEPKCYLRWGDEYGTTFSIYRDFNWFQKKMLKWCFGLDYIKK